jgi:type III secretory pathway component EscR
MCRFPRDKHDDQVDAMSYLGLMLNMFVEGPTNKEIEEALRDEEMESYMVDEGLSEITGY